MKKLQNTSNEGERYFLQNVYVTLFLKSKLSASNVFIFTMLIITYNFTQHRCRERTWVEFSKENTASTSLFAIKQLMKSADPINRIQWPNTRACAVF